MERFRIHTEQLTSITRDGPRGLVVEAHNDDVSLYRMMSLLTQQGAELSVVTLTDGAARNLETYSAEELPKIRWKESGTALRIAGVSQRSRIDLPDGSLANYADAGMRFLDEQIGLFNPDFVVAPHEMDSHPDHAAAANIALTTVGEQLPVYAMDTISGLNRDGVSLMPDAYVSLPQRTARREKQVYLTHESQVKQLPREERTAVMSVLGMTARRGKEIGVRHASVIFRANKHVNTPVENLVRERIRRREEMKSV